MTTVAPPLDYYVVSAGPAHAVVVEEFVLAEDHSAVSLNSAGWSAADGRWRGAAAVSRKIRTDPALRAGVVVADRDAAADAYRGLGGGRLPDETTLRTYFHDSLDLVAAAPLRFGGEVPEGFRAKQIHRILFANDLTPQRLEHLRSVWRMVPARDEEHWRSGVVGVARRRFRGDLYVWELRQISRSVAWCVDLTGYLAGDAGADVTGSLLRELRATVRQQGLIPVTVERLG